MKILFQEKRKNKIPTCLYNRIKFHPYNKISTDTKKIILYYGSRGSLENKKKSTSLSSSDGVSSYKSNKLSNEPLDNRMKIVKNILSDFSFMDKCDKTNTIVQVEQQIPFVEKEKKNLELEIDDNILDDIIVDTLGNENISPLEEFVHEFMSWESNEEKLLITNNTIKPNIYEIQTKINKKKIEQITTVLEDEKSFYYDSDLLETSKNTDRKVEINTEDNKYTSIDEDEKNESTIEANQSQVNLQSLPEGYLIKNMYLCKFSKTVVELININNFIKDINVNNKDEIKEKLNEISNIYGSCVGHMDFCLTYDKKYAANMAIKNLINEISKYNKNCSDFSLDTRDSIGILDSTVCMHLFLQLSCNFTIEIIKCLRRNKKHFFTNKKEVMAYCPKKGEELTKNVEELRDLFTSLLTKISRKNKLYNLRDYYAAVFLIDNVFNNEKENDLFSLIPYLIEELLKIGNRFISFYQKMFMNKKIHLCELVNITENDDDSTNNGQHIRNLLNLLNEKQKKIEKELRSCLREPKLMSLYILYHFSYLILHRCFNSKEIENDLQDCFNVYRSFISLWNSNFSHLDTSLATYYDLEETDRFHICNDDTSIHFIFSYILLQIVKASLMEVHKNHMKYIDMLKNYFYNGKHGVETNIFLKRTEFYRYSIVRLKYVADALKEINLRRSLLVPSLKLYSVGDAVNKHINKILSMLKNLKCDETPDEIQTKIIQEYDLFIPMYHIYMELAK